MKPNLLVLLLLWSTSVHTAHRPSVNRHPPRWETVGDSVILSCQHDEGSPLGWITSWHPIDLKDVDVFSFNDNLLQADIEHGSGGFYSIIPVGLNHPGVYVCRDESDGQNAESLNVRFLYVAGPSPSASLSVSPNSVQHVSGESVAVSCGEQRNSTGWRVKRITSKRLSECGTDWGSVTGSTCTFTTELPDNDNGVYWCESDSGEHSQAVNISVFHDRDVILESPALPVTEGDAVTLRCRLRLSFNLIVEFYKDGSLISTERSGEMTIPSVSASDEGEYHCRIPALRRPSSSGSWLSVRASSPAPAPLMSWSRLLCSVVVSSPYLLTTIILVAYCRDKNTGAHPKRVRRNQEVSSDQVVCIQMT